MEHNHTRLAMKTLLTLLFAWLAMTLNAANPSYANFNTNQFLRVGNNLNIGTNSPGTTGQVLTSDGTVAKWSTPTSGGSQVWTNDGTVVRLANPSTTLDLSTINTNTTSLQGTFYSDLNFGVAVMLTVTNSAADNGIDLMRFVGYGIGANRDYNAVLDVQSYQAADDGGEVITLEGQYLGTGSATSDSRGWGVAGYSSGDATSQYGVYGSANGGGTNISVIGKNGNLGTGTNVALAGSITSQDPVRYAESSVLFLEQSANAGSDVPFVIAKMYGTNVLKVDPTGNVRSLSYRHIDGSIPDVGGITANIKVITNGTDTATLQFYRGVLTNYAAP